ncbi:uncharacterized protein LOC119093082 isoform X1 [Pollicipes pollicipes]|uniref:uncharacterized protein LOC119093082 isoform X1 n=1 Tax=Pollicipes pollicipes TaxID=41117 RepID=UPI001884AD36|nr:uncharacterized protein LOC119093082 isoform X1 [Pollicipes pollicipes]
MPYYLWEPEDVVVLPRRRTLARLSDELDDDPVLKWYEDRIHHAQAEAIANANKRISDLCTPRPRHISVVPPYTPKRYKEPVSSQYKYSKYRPPITEDMKPIRRNIEIKSRFDKAQSAAQNDYKRMGDCAERSTEQSASNIKPGAPETSAQENYCNGEAHEDQTNE